MRQKLIYATCIVAVLVYAAVLHHSPSIRRGSPISFQGAPSTTSFAGVVDPTNISFAGGMVKCNSSCSSAISDQNRAALKAAIDYSASSSHPRRVHIPSGQYPIKCGVDLGGDSNVDIEGWNVTLRMTGDQSSVGCSMIKIYNGSNIAIRGVSFSMRDAINVVADTVALKIGDGGATTVTNVRLTDVQFVEGGGGDYLRIDGGLSAVTVSNVLIERSRFEDGARVGVDVRPGVQKLSVMYDFFRNNANRDVWVENSGDGPIGQIIVQGNFFERSASATGQAVTLAGNGGTNVFDRSLFVYNHIKPIPGNTTGGGTLEVLNASNLLIAWNPTIITNLVTSAPSISVTGKITNVEILGNYVERDATANDAAVIKLASDGVNAPSTSMVRSNRVFQYSGASPGIDVSGCSRCDVTRNNVSYFNATADSGATGFAAVYCSGSVNACSGNYSQNRLKQESGAGRPLATIEILKGTGTTVGQMILKQNWTDGARDLFYMDATGSTQYPEGYPIISQNAGINFTNEFEGGILTWTPETTNTAETVTTGATGVSKTMTFITTSGTKTYTQADGVVDGQIHCFKVTAATSTPAGTWTPTHFADGTTHTITWTTIPAGGLSWCVTWDNTAATYRLQNITGATLN